MPFSLKTPADIRQEIQIHLDFMRRFPGKWDRECAYFLSRFIDELGGLAGAW